MRYRAGQRKDGWGSRARLKCRIEVRGGGYEEGRIDLGEGKEKGMGAERESEGERERDHILKIGLGGKVLVRD